MESFFEHVLLLAGMIFGLVSIPFGLPGTIIILLCTFVYALLTHFSGGIGVPFFVSLCVLTLLAETADHWLTAIGARRYGASTASMLPSGIRTVPSGVNSDARRSWSFIITASVNSPTSAAISTRSASSCMSLTGFLLLAPGRLHVPAHQDETISGMGLAYLQVLRSAPLPDIFEILRPFIFDPRL